MTNAALELEAIERERRRVAKELHDEILPSLARLIRSIESQSDADQHEALIGELHNMVAAFRDVLGELHPVDLEELGMAAALNNLCARYGRLTSRSILFSERSEECSLTPTRQLFLYRAIQAAFRMFEASGNDVLVVAYDVSLDHTEVSLRCVDKVMLAHDWLASGNPEFDVFEYLCDLAGAHYEVGPHRLHEEFPLDLLITIPDTAVPETSIHWTRTNQLFESLALQSERKRIAQDINRMILPHLVRVRSLSDASENSLLAIAVHDRMHLITTEITAVIGEAHPHLLEQAGLVPSIITLVDRFSRASSIESTIEADLSSGDIGINSDAKFAIYRATQEALNNVEKHSVATNARIAIRRDQGKLVVEIEDNGKGFEHQTSVQSRGLKIIRERAHAVGAKVSWQTALAYPSGTLVRISLPYACH